MVNVSAYRISGLAVAAACNIWMLHQFGFMAYAASTVAEIAFALYINFQ